MLRGVSGIRVVGLVFLLLSLFEPLTLATTVAEGAPPPPDETLLEGTPASEPAPEPTVELLPTEPAPEPTVAPTVEPTLEPTAVPTVEPTVEPTIEPTIPPTAAPIAEPPKESTPEPTASRSLGSVDTNADPPVTISVEPVNAEVTAGEDISFRVTLTTDEYRFVNWSMNLPGAEGLSWNSSNTLTCWFPEGTPATLNCNPYLYVDSPFVVTVTSPTTSASCGTYDVVADVNSPSPVAISSDPATVTVHCPEPEPGISINTAAEPTAGRIGDDVTFTYEITNTGNVPLTSIGVTDSLLGDVVDCDIATLPANGESDHITTCSGTYTIDADDVADGQITSSATVNAMFDETNVSSASGDVIIDVLPEPEPAVTISKVADEAQMPFGGVPGFTIMVTNEGDAPATDVAFEDHLPYQSSLPWELQSQFAQCDIYQDPVLLECAGIDLEPGDDFEVHVTAQRRYTADCDRTLESTARLTQGGVGEATASVYFVCPDPVVTVELDNDVVTAGDDIGLTVTFSNLYPASYGLYFELPERYVSGVDLGSHCEEGSNCRFNASGDYPISITHYLEGRTFSSSCGTHEFSAVISHPVYRRAEPVTLTILCPEPDVTITRSVEPATGRIGDEVTFTYEITNTGNVPLSDVTVTEDVLGDVAACALATLPANGESDHIDSCSGTYTIDANDVVDGQVVSDAAVSAFHDETEITGSAETTVIDVLPEPEPVLSITKVADEAQMPYGGVPGFTITVTNEGDAPATGVAFEDYLPYRGGLPWELRSQFNHCVLDLNNDELLECSGINLEPGDDFEVRVSAFYGYSAMCDTTLESTAQLTQGGEGEATASIYVVCPDLTITVLPDSDEVIAGNDLGVTIRISNTSSFEADPVTIIGQLPAASGLEWSTTGPGCYISSTAKLDCFHVTIPANGSLDVWFSSPTTDASCGEYSLSGEVDHPYLIDATHSATITVLCFEPELPEITQAACVDGEFTAPEIELATTDHVTYTLDPASGWAAGDTVTVIATLEEGYDWPAQTPDSWHPVPDAPSQLYREIEMEIPDCPSMEISRSIEPTFARLGDEVTLSYEITNTGNVPLEDVYVSDYLLGTVPSCSLDVFPPGGDGEHTHQCTATTTVVEQPGREGIFQSDWASVWGNHDGEWLTASAGSVSVTIEQDNPVTIAADAETVTAGEEIGFTITVGDSISRIFIYNHLNSAGHIYDWTITADDPSSCWSWADDYPVWQPFNCEWEETSTPRAVTVHATAPTTIESCGTVELDSMVLVNHVQHDLDPVTVTVLCPEVSVDLSSEPIAGTEVREGDEITYTLTLTNTGEVPLTNVAVDTDITGLADDPISDLEVDGSVTRSGTYTVAPGDVAAEQITRSANATGDASTGVGTAPTDPVTLTHPVTQSPSIGLDIDADRQEPSGEHPLGAIDYTLSVTNTGDSTLTDIAITAPLLNEEPIPVADLGPGRDATIEATYALTQADIDAGHITTEASVGGMPPTGPSGVRDYANITVDLTQETGLAVDMSTDADEVAEGDELTVTFTVINTGTVTIRDITITTTLADLVWATNDTTQTSIRAFAQAQTDGMVGDLGPGESQTRTATYTATGDDVDRGEFVIEATVTGLGVDGEITATAEPVAITVVQPAPDPDPTPEPTPEPTVPPTPEPTVPPTVDPDPTVPPTGDPEATATAPATPAADGTAINVSSLPSTGAGANGGTIAGMGALLVAALLAAGGLIAHRQRR